MPRWNNPNCGFQKGHKDFRSAETIERLSENLGKIAKANKGHKPYYVAFGKDNKSWKGGKVKMANGYILLSLNGSRKLEHRYIMEQYLGRPLEKKEVVHHINEVRNDNRIENLALLSSQSEHARLHQEIYRMVRL